MLTVSVERRATLEAVKSHPWMAANFSQDSLLSYLLPVPASPAEFSATLSSPTPAHRSKDEPANPQPITPSASQSSSEALRSSSSGSSSPWSSSSASSGLSTSQSFNSKSFTQPTTSPAFTFGSPREECRTEELGSGCPFAAAMRAAQQRQAELEAQRAGTVGGIASGASDCLPTSEQPQPATVASQMALEEQRGRKRTSDDVVKE